MQLHQHLVFTDFRDSRFLECKAIKAIVLVLDDPLLHCRGSHSVNKSRKGMCNRSIIKCTEYSANRGRRGSLYTLGP